MFFPVCLHADEFSTEQKKPVYPGDNASESEPMKPDKTENSAVNNSVNDTQFSDYPKTFIIPKGVCETNKPAMIIELKKE